MSSSQHPSEGALAGFIAGELSADESRAVVRHLLHGCEACRRITSRLWPPATREDAPVPELDLSTVRLRARESAIGEERKQAAPLLEELQAHPQHRRMMLVLNSRRFHSWFVAQAICDKVSDLVFRRPDAALEWSRAAVAIAERLPPERYSAALINDMRARSWAAYANALRLNSELAEAGEAFKTAEAALEAGTGDPMEEAQLFRRKATYWKTMRRNREAIRCYDRTIRLLRSIGDEHELGRALADKGAALCTAGDLEGAIRLTEKALGYIDAVRDPRSVLAAKHNLSLYLHQEGDIERAMTLLQEILPLYARQNEPMVLLRLRWLEGRLAQTQREFRRAEKAFREVQQGFVERKIPYEAAFVSFDLATIFIEEERWTELAELAAEILVVFRALEIPRETIAAVELLKRASEARRVSIAWLGELAEFVERAQNKPGLTFKPSKP